MAHMGMPIMPCIVPDEVLNLAWQQELPGYRTQVELVSRCLEVHSNSDGSDENAIASWNGDIVK
jgi:hypothetical protein